MSAKKPTDLMQRLAELDWSERLFSEVTGIPLQRATELHSGLGEPITPDEAVRVRILKNELAAVAAADRIRRKQANTLQKSRDDERGHFYAGGYHGPSITRSNDLSAS